MNPKTGSYFLGRKMDYFHHDSGSEWGYTEVRTDTFAVLYPKNVEENKKYPLYVVYHSAGHSLYSTILAMKHEGDHDIYHVPEDMYGLILDCRTNEDRDWWWGGRGINGNFEEDSTRAGTEPGPAERRCLDTVKWTMANYPIDEQRVYAVGNSMGGSGSLGNALCRGDIYAAIKANVPAGVRHAADRCCLDREAPDGFEIPDPPIVVDYSAQDDSWSKGHEIFYNGMKEKKYALMGFWGKFGHANNNAVIAEKNDLIHSFDIFSVKKNEAYPVFTDASTDDKIPWPDNIESEASGQVNAFFRWDVKCDCADYFEIELRLMRRDEWQTRVELPQTSTADVSLRRLQNFRPVKGEKLSYNFGEIGGRFEFDGSLITIDRLVITDKPKSLKIYRI